MAVFKREAEPLDVALSVLGSESRQRQLKFVGAALVGTVAKLGDVILDDRRAARLAVRAAQLDLPVAWAVAIPFDRLHRVAAAFAAVEQLINALLQIGFNRDDLQALIGE